MEVLVVIALMVLLSAILFPVFAQAREKARQARCMSHLKQLALGMRLYSEDHDQMLPPALAWQGSEELLFPTTWASRLLPYLQATGVFLDPSSGRLDPDWHTSADLLANYGYPPSWGAPGAGGAGRDRGAVWHGDVGGARRLPRSSGGRVPAGGAELAPGAGRPAHGDRAAV
jgi:type II secretory pathway pseudopilin PulG